MKVKTIIKRWGGAHLEPKVLRRYLKEALQETALFWHSRLLPRHFRMGAAQEYGYKPRSPKTRERKRRAGVHPPIALVTKKSELRELSTRQASVSGSSKRARVSFSVPPSTRQQYVREITTVSAKDEKALSKVLDRAMQERIDGDKTTETKIIQ